MPAVLTPFRDTRQTILDSAKADGFIPGAIVRVAYINNKELCKVCAVPGGSYVGPGYYGTPQALAMIETLLLHNSAWIVLQGY